MSSSWRGIAPPIFATSPSLMDVIPEGAGNPEISLPIAVCPVDAVGGVEGCPASGAEVGAKVGVGVDVGYGTGEYGSPFIGGGGGGPGSSSAVTGEGVEMMLEGCDSLDESESLEGINALQMAIPENRSTNIVVNTTITFFFIFCFVTPYFFIPLPFFALLCATCNLYTVLKFSTGDIKTRSIFAHDEQINYEDAKKRADDKRLSAFSIFSKIFSRPDVNEIVLCYSEKRYEPFWYLVYSRWWTCIKAKYKRASIHKKEK